MKISLQWLNDYIDLRDYNDRLDELSSLLTKSGLEVEDMENPSAHWDHIVVGELLEVGRHPDADKLTLCKVNVGGQEPLQIVCGAKNHKQGDKVAVATVGAVLPGDFKIKKSKIRGVESFGMLCSKTELGLSEESDGILIMDKAVKVGAPLKEAFGEGDVVFELNVTPNRADCLSHIGLARELSTLLDRPVKKTSPEIRESGKAIDDWIKVQLKDDQGCPRYCGRIISGVKVGPSPTWLQQRLQAVGVNSINNIVDITNYVLFEYGQPLHAFDYSQIQKQTITIEKAKTGESFTTLDGTEVKLNDHDLLIKDGGRAVALAGVVGGQNSGVSASTTDIFLESAFFTAEGVRKTSRAHGIETDSCYRFSRGVDPEQTLAAMDRAAALIQELGGGEIQKGHVDLYPKPVEFNPIKISIDYVSERLGFTIEAQDFVGWMKRLCCQVNGSGDTYEVTPPSYRWDLNIPEDLVEEFARLHGYDQLEETLPKLVEEPTPHAFAFDFNNKVSQLLAGLGVYQSVNYAFTGENLWKSVWGRVDVAQSCGLKISEAPVKLKNPISEELAVMRESLLPSLLKNVSHNNNHGISFGRLFELAPTHYREGEVYKEEMRLALAFWGQAEGLWDTQNKIPLIYTLKMVVEGLLTKIGAKNWRWQNMAELAPGFHPGQSIQLFYEGKIVGLMGTMHPQLKADQKIRSEVAWAEFNFEALSARQPRQPQFHSLPKFPSVERDIALLGPETVSAQDIGAEIKRAAGPLLESFQVFDVYQDKALKEAGQRSIAFRMHFQSAKETLNDEQVNELRDKVVNSVCQKLGLEIR
ncbi:MAG: phenylalanine--tRNA ligase subunit beta [Bdellovibrionales bacterium]|nr:phenylalanine--tRNA ligase subunit beta [Bdellovibrionales bacterium]